MDNESYFSDDEKKEESDDESDTSSIEEVENEDTEIEEIEVPDDDEDNVEVSDEEDSETNSQTGGVKDFEEDENNTENNQKKIKKIPGKNVNNNHDDNEEDDDDDGEMYLQKFDKEVNDNYIVNFHPESILHNYDEILAMIQVVRDTDDIIIDDLHKTIPYLTKYEKARILGQRAKQINSGAIPFIKVPENIIDGYLIAELELKEKRIPFIIRRPLPNGGSEYWSIRDLENIIF
jgi:DNA-directed RNA polymerase I, II, and III subunit RPABC2